MIGLAAILVIVGIILLLIDVFAAAAKVLLWVGIILAIVGVVVWLVG